MHELGVLRHIAKTVDRIAREQLVSQVKHIAIEVGDASGFVPMYLTKLYPIAAEAYSVLKNAELKIAVVPGTRLIIKEIGY